MALIQVAQRLGIPLAEIGAALAALPAGRTPRARTGRRWHRPGPPISTGGSTTLTRLRDRLAGCIGCGCLSIDRCALYNPDDRLAGRGVGPVLLRGIEPPTDSDVAASNG